MKKIKHLLTIEEKFIVENHFLYNKNSSRKNFKDFSEKVIKTYVDEKFNFNDKNNYLNSEDYQIEIIVDQNENKTLMMHIFEQYNFEFSNSKYKALCFFRPNINELDINNENAVMKLAKSNKNVRHALQLLINEDFNILQENLSGLNIFAIMIDSLINREKYSRENFTQDKIIMAKYSDPASVFSLFSTEDVFNIIINEWINKGFGYSEKSDNLIIENSFDLIDKLRVKASVAMKVFPKQYTFDDLLKNLENIEKKVLAKKLNKELKVSSYRNKKNKI